MATPGSSTTVAFGRIMLWNSQEMRVEVASGRGDVNAQKAVAVNVTNNPTLGAGSNFIGSTRLEASTSGSLISTARITGNATQAYGSIKAAIGQLYGYELYNTQSTVRFVHFYNKVNQPTLGTDTPLFTVALPPTSRVALASDICLAVFSTGIEYQITTDDSTIPATAGAAGDVVGTVMYY